MLVNWLNHTDDEEAKTRITQIVSLYLELWFLCQESKAATEKRAGRKWIPTRHARSSQTRRVWKPDSTRHWSTTRPDRGSSSLTATELIPTPG